MRWFEPRSSACQMQATSTTTRVSVDTDSRRSSDSRAPLSVGRPSAFSPSDW